MEPSKDIVPQGAYPQSTLDEFKTPYSKEFDSVRGYNPIGAFNQPYANFNTDWETEFISEEGQAYMRVVEGLKQEKAERNKRIQEEIRIQEELQYERERQSEQIKEITHVLLEAMNNQTDMSYQSCSPPPVNNYVPHYTKPWTKSELAKVGAYSTKPSEAQTVYAQAATKQDRAWAASMKNQIKWKK
jgi:hypothetical protein